MNNKTTGWHPPYIDKRNVTEEELLGFFPVKDRMLIRYYMVHGLVGIIPEWKAREFTVMNALKWHTLDFSQKMLAAVFTYGYIAGQRHEDNKENGR